MHSTSEIPLKLHHIGLIVRDKDAVSEGLLGLGLPILRTVDNKMKLEDMDVGKPGHSGFNLHDLGGVGLETIQPIGKDGVSAESLGKRGEGFNHICFEVAVQDFDRILKRCQDMGWESLWAGHPRGRRWHYFDTKLGGLIIEFIEEEKS